MLRFYLSYDTKISLKSHFWRKMSSCTQCCYGRYIIHVTFPENLLTTSGLMILMHGVISLPDPTSYDN